MKMNYKLFQIKKEKLLNTPYAFNDTPVCSLKELDFFNNYELAYTGDIEFNKFIETTIDDLFIILNTNKRPKDYKCRSMSVSDIVLINNDFYYCERNGYKRLNIL